MEGQSWPDADSGVTGRWHGASGQADVGEVGDADKLEKDQTLMLRPIVTDRTESI